MEKPSFPNSMVSSRLRETVKKKIVSLEDHLYVNGDDCFDLPKGLSIPYLSSVDLQKLEPHHFGLMRWQSTFRLPDSWMKRIYLHEVYSDTEVPLEEPEKLTKVQKEILREHVEITRKALDLPGIMTKFYSRTKPPVDKLLQTLKNQENLLLNGNLKKLKEAEPGQGIADLPVHISHQVNCERMVAKIAVDKMKIFSKSEETAYMTLLKDRRFMEKLNGLVESYLEENHCFEAE